MVLKQKPTPEQGAPNRCYHATTPTASKSRLWLNAARPIAEMVDLFALRDLSSCLDVGDPMSQLLPSVYSLSAVAFPIQAVSPYKAVSPDEVRGVYWYGNPEAIGRSDSLAVPTPMGFGVTGLGKATPPFSNNCVSLVTVVSRHINLHIRRRQRRPRLPRTKSRGVNIYPGLRVLATGAL